MGITFFDGGEVARGWRWRTAKEGDVLPAEMETRHVFYTLRMIWNNTVPEHMEVGVDPIYYRWGPRHPRSYLLEAVRHLGRELSTRQDMTPEWQRELAQMASWFREDTFDEAFRMASPKIGWL